MEKVVHPENTIRLIWVEARVGGSVLICASRRRAAVQLRGTGFCIPPPPVFRARPKSAILARRQRFLRGFTSNSTASPSCQAAPFDLTNACRWLRSSNRNRRGFHATRIEQFDSRYRIQRPSKSLFSPIARLRAVGFPLVDGSLRNPQTHGLTINASRGKGLRTFRSTVVSLHDCRATRCEAVLDKWWWVPDRKSRSLSAGSARRLTRGLVRWAGYRCKWR